MNIIVIIKIIAFVDMFNEVVIGECENGSFQNLASHAASSSRRKERLVSLQHQLGKISRRVEDREETLQLEVEQAT